MSNSDYFWIGFLTCYIIVAALGMVLVYVASLVERLIKLRKLKKEQPQ